MYRRRRPSISRLACVALATCLLFPSLASAQFDTATVLGTVRDASGSHVPGVSVTLNNVNTGITATAVTAPDGSYQFLNVRVGTYVVRAELAGFSTAVAENIAVTVNARLRVDLTLTVGNLDESVIVTGSAPVLESESSERGQVIGREQIVNLPLNGRNYADLALLAPGVRRSGIADSRDASFNVNGQRSALNNFILDGVDNNNYGTSNQGFSNQVVQVSPDAVQEFKVQTDAFSAEFGRSGGAVINATFRSGTNQFRGTAWEFHRNTALNATGFFKPTTGVKPTLVRNQYGFVFGGPIIRNRTFFFGHYEGFRQVSRTLTFATLPTPAQRQGILGRPIRHPLTGVLYADGVIPASAITPFAARVLAGLPDPTRPGVANNFDSLPRRQDYNDKFDVKLDHNFSPGTTAFVRYSHRKVDNFEPPPIPGVTGSPSNAFVHVLNRQLAGGATHTLNASSLLEVRFGVSPGEAGKYPPGVGQPGMLEAYGIPGLPTDPRFAGGLTQQGVSGWTTWGQQSSNPQFQNPFVINGRVNFTRLAGRHSIKTGYEYQAINTEIDDFNPKYGSDGYSGQFSRPAGAPADPATYNLADFMFGARSSYSLVNPFIANLRQRMHFAYVQDDFRMTERLTLNLGLRYEFATPQWERDNYLTNFDPATNTLIQATSGSIADRALVKPDRNNVAPRLGAAFKLTPRTVLRGGFGVSYVHFNRLGGENLLSFNGPHVVQVDITQQPSQGLCVGNQAPTTCFRPTQQGYPQGLNVPANYSTLNARVNHIPFDSPTASVRSWHFTVQRELAENLLLEVAYVGNAGRNLVILGDYNQARPNGPTENLTLQARRPIQGYQFIQAAFAGGDSDYRALQAKIERRFSRGLYLLNSFTWSRSVDLASGHLESQNGDNSRVNIRDLDYQRGVSGYNQPLNNTTSLVWDVPFGRGQRFGANMNAIMDGVLGGWRMTAINTMTSGLPVNLTYSPAAAFQVSGAPTYRPNLVGPALAPSGERSIDNYFDKTNVVIPTDRSQPFGNAPRNAVRGYAFYQTDLGLHKSFNLPGQHTRLEVRGEFFNVLNKTNFGSPNGNASAAAFGTIRSTSPARQIQLGVKLYF
jgi:hypothetical protein